jgi:hypothetical protein
MPLCTINAGIPDGIYLVHLFKRFGGAPHEKTSNENTRDDFEKTRSRSRPPQIDDGLPILSAGGRAFRQGISPNHWHARFTERDHDH